MNTIKKNRSLISIIIFLLITNIAMLIFFVTLNKPAQNEMNEEQGRFSNSLQKDVGFSKEQFDKYQALRKAHFEKMHPLFNDMRNTKYRFYDFLYSPPTPDSLINNATELIGEKQKQLDIQMFHYFESLRKICTPEQLPKFDTAVKKLIIRLTERPGKNGHSHN